MKKMLSLVLALAMVLSLTTIVWATELDAAPENWSTVLASAKDDDTINLEAGTYDLGTLGSGVAKDLTIVGTEGTVVNYFGVGAVDCGNLTIKNCTFTDNSVWCFICIEGKGTFTFDNCDFVVAEGESAGSAIYMTAQYADNAYIVKNCSFAGEFNEAAVVVQNSAPGAYDVTVSGNDFDDVVGDSVGVWNKDATVDLDSDVDEVTLIHGSAAEFEAAVAAAESGDTIKLMGNVDLTNTPVEITNPININDNGNTLTGLAAGSDITTNAEGKITGGTFADLPDDSLLADDADISIVSSSGPNTGINSTDKSVQAAARFNNKIETYDKTNDAWDDVTDEVVEFGKTVYVALKTQSGNDVTSADAVANVKVDAKWTENGEYIDSVKIVKVDGIYAIAVATTGSSLENVQIEGSLQLSGKSRNKDSAGETISTVSLKDMKTDFSLELGYDVRDAGTSEDVVADEKVVVNFEDIDDEDYVIEYGDKIDVETYMKNTKKVLIAYNETENDDLVDAYVDADLSFYNCTGAFRRTCTVTIEAEEGSYLYQVVDGELVAVDAEYDEWEEAFVFKTRTMGNYVVSDVELVVEEVVAANPSTGAAA